jgi:hypothetical protein
MSGRRLTVKKHSNGFNLFRLNFRVAGAMRLNQSAAAVAAGFCFIISSIPFFISFAEGSALWVPTIQL